MKKITILFVMLLVNFIIINDIFAQHTRVHLTGGGTTTTALSSLAGFTSTGSPTVDYSPGSLSYSPFSPANLPVAGGKIKILGNTVTGAGASFANYALPASYSSGSVFVSFLFKMNTNSFSGDIRNFQFYLGNNYTATSGERTAMFHTRGRPLTGDFVQFAATKSGLNNNLSTAVFNGNANTLNAANTNGQTFNAVPSSATYFVVMRYEFKTGGTNNDEVTMWVFSNNQGLPSPTSIPTSGAIVAGDNATILDVAAINQIGFTYGLVNPAGPGAYSDVEFDAINVGTSWAEVIPHVRQTPSTVTDFGNVALNAQANNPQTINVRGNALTPGSNVSVFSNNANFLVSTTTITGTYSNATSPFLSISEADVMSTTGKNIFVDFRPTTSSGAQTGVVQALQSSNSNTALLNPSTSNVSGTIAAACPTITLSSTIPSTTFGITTGSPISYTFSVVGGTGTTSYAISAGSLPSGITLNSTSGVLSGTTNLSGFGTFSVTATRSSCPSNVLNYNYTLCGTASISPTSFTAADDATVGVAYSKQLTQTGLTGTLIWSVSPAFPSGITLNQSTGLISGTATAVSTLANYVVTVNSVNGCSANRTYSFAVNAVPCPTISITPATIPSGVVGTAYSQQLAQTGLTGTVTWSVSPTTFPSGITLNQSTGLISGTATATSTSANYVITASNGTCSQTINYTFGIVAVPTLTANPTSLPAFAQTTGGQLSVVQTYTLTGTNVTANITVTAPTNFQVAKGTGTSVIFASTASVTAAEANAGQVISVRFAPTLSIPTGNASGSITHSGFTNTNVAVSASAVTELENWSNNFQILGNPTREFVRVRCDNASEWQNADVSFTTLEGKPSFVSKWENANNILEVNINKWQKGIYVLRITKGKKIATQKIVVE